jgi:putative ABC transport system permease protein
MMTTVARLRPGVTDPQLASRLGDEARSWNEQYHSGSRAGKTLSSIGFIEHLVGPLRQILLVLMGAVVFVLLIAAANVAGLQLVRTSGRVREMAVRAAMGASRGRIARQLLLESGLLAVIGGVLGLGVGVLSLLLLERWEPAQQMSISDIALDPRVLAFTGVLAIGSAVLFGTLPALRASRVDPQATLRDGGRGTSLGQGRSRLLRASVVVQLSLALVLLLGSGLMIRTLTRLLESDPGFQPDGLVTAELSIGGKEYGETARKLVFFDALLERVRALPGISEAALVWGLPFTDQGDSSPFDIPGRPARPGEPERHAEARIVSAGYFHTMRIPLLRGRDFNGREREGSTTEAIVDRTFADQFFPGENPVGRQIIGYTGDPSTIIGVVDRVDQREIGDAPKAVVYYSYRQLPWSGKRSLVVRSSLPSAAVAAMLRSAVADLDRGVPLFDIQTMHDRIESTLGPRRLALLALGVFGALSLLLSSLGVYGVMRHVTRQRTQELGIRMAVGASPRQVLGLVLRQGVSVALLGITLGLIGALAVTRLMAGILYGVSPHDPIAVLGATVLLLCVVLAASWAPAHRASRTDPVQALRAD